MRVANNHFSRRGLLTARSLVRCSSSRPNSRTDPQDRNRAFRRGNNSEIVARLRAGDELAPERKNQGNSSLGMMEMIFLGTSSAAPSISRNQQSLALGLDGETWLFDCGEGTQLQMIRAGIAPLDVSRIFISHLHGDHVFGLPSLMASMGAASMAQVFSTQDVRRWDKVRLSARFPILSIYI